MKRSTTVHQKPWGTEEIWASTHHTIGKILIINPFQRLSRKYHRIKNHTIRIMEGVLFLEVGPLAPGGGIETISLRTGEVYYLSAQTIHRFCAGEQRVKLLEVSNAGASDSVRLEDDYRRITKIPIVGPHSEK